MSSCSCLGTSSLIVSSCYPNVFGEVEDDEGFCGACSDNQVSTTQQNVTNDWKFSLTILLKNFLKFTRFSRKLRRFRKFENPLFLFCSNSSVESTTAGTTQATTAGTGSTPTFTTPTTEATTEGTTTQAPPLDFSDFAPTVSEFSAPLSNSELITLLESTQQKCPDITRVFTLGSSYNGNDLKAIEFSTNAGVSDPSKARIGLLANMHGNEASGRSILSWFIEYFCENKDSSSHIQNFLTNAQIIIVPTLNPDGFEIRTGSAYDTNANKWSFWTLGRQACNVADGCSSTNDMNRDFDDVTGAFHDDNSIAFDKTKIDQKLEENSVLTSNYGKTSESEIIKNFFDNIPLDFAFNYHDGTQVISYALDKSVRGTNVDTPGPDDKLYRQMSLAYANEWPSWCDSSWSEKKITNGADWYSIAGGMQDYHYLKYGTMHVTIEVSCMKFLQPSSIGAMVRNNAKGLFVFIDHVTNKVPSIYGVSAPGSKIEFIQGDEVYFTVSDEIGNFKKSLPQVGIWEVCIDDLCDGEFVEVTSGGSFEFVSSESEGASEEAFLEIDGNGIVDHLSEDEIRGDQVWSPELDFESNQVMHIGE